MQKRNRLVRFILLYIILGHWAKEIVILEKNFCWAVKTVLILSSRKICEKELPKSTLLLLYLDFQQKKRKIGEEPSAVLSKLPISWSDGTFAGKTFFLNTTTFLSYSGFEQKLSDTYWNCFGRFVNTAFYVSRKVLRGRVFPREVYSFNIFRLWAKNNWNSTAEILQWRQNCILCNQGERFRKFFNFFSSFS